VSSSSQPGAVGRNRIMSWTYDNGPPMAAVKIPLYRFIASGAHPDLARSRKVAFCHLRINM